jgi:hypothetical protein
MKTIEEVKEFLNQRKIDYKKNIPEQNCQTYRDGMLEIIIDTLEFIREADEND